jgi:hypothetical protein
MVTEAEDLIAVILRGLRQDIDEARMAAESLWALGSLCRYKANAVKMAEAALQLLDQVASA